LAMVMLLFKKHWWYRSNLKSIYEFWKQKSIYFRHMTEPKHYCQKSLLASFSIEQIANGSRYEEIVLASMQWPI
jgi:hypothetical protein